MNYTRILRYLSGYIAIYHLALGVLGIFASSQLLQKLIELFYGPTLNIDDTLFYVAKFISAYFVAFGGMMLFVALNPVKYRQFIAVAVAFFAVRLGELLYFYNFIGENFRIPDNRILGKIVLVTALGGALVFLEKKIKSDQTSIQ